MTWFCGHYQGSSLASPILSRDKQNMSVPTTHPFAFDPTYGMQLEQLMAFTVTDDHARQEQVC